MTERIKRLINRKNKRDVMTFIWNSVLKNGKPYLLAGMQWLLIGMLRW